MFTERQTRLQKKSTGPGVQACGGLEGIKSECGQRTKHEGLCKPCQTHETSHAREEEHSPWVVSMETAGCLSSRNHMGHGTREKEAEISTHICLSQNTWSGVGGEKFQKCLGGKGCLGGSVS